MGRLVAIFAVCVLLLGALQFMPRATLPLLRLVIKGQTLCPFGLTMTSMENVHKVLATKEQLNQSARLVQTDGDIEQWSTANGTWWMQASGGGPFDSLTLAEDAMGIYGTGERAVRKGDIVLDCGAEIGTFTRTALNQGAKLVVAIEPAPLMLSCLRRNFEREIADHRVVVYPKGVWNEETSLTLYGDSVAAKKTDSGVVVPLTTIDKLVSELNLPRVDFIKMDIEGAEKQALTGGRATIQKFRPRFAIATEHLPDDAVAIPNLIRSMDRSYKQQCAFCEFADGHIRPEVMYLF
jgi:FkbM family methyltransferase